MLECLILGDSIAHGIAMHMPKCRAVTQVGISSKTFNKRHVTFSSAKLTIISLGTNDDSKTTYEQLQILREKITSDKVIWILPSESQKLKQRIAVEELADEYDDEVFSIAPILISSDRIHPTGKGYKTVSTQLK